MLFAELDAHLEYDRYILRKTTTSVMVIFRRISNLAAVKKISRSPGIRVPVSIQSLFLRERAWQKA